MANMKFLEEIGLKEVSQKTHIEIKFLKYIIDSDFAKLNRTNSIGFVKIISREYNVDLTEWLEEAREYWDKESLSHQGSRIFIAQKPKVYSKVFLIILSFIVLLAILYGAYMFLNSKLNFFENTVTKKDVNFTYEETPAVNKAKKTLVKSIVIDEINKTSNNMGSETTFTKKDENISEDLNNLTIEAMPEDKQTQPDIKKNSFISANTKLWLGVIYLNSFKRDSYLGDGNYTINATKDQLITTGHGHFTLYFNGAIRKFNSPESIRLMVKDGSISVITKEKFMKFNKGSLW